MLNISLFKKYPIFSEVPQEQLSEILPFIELLEFDSNEIIFREGDAADHLYGIRAGEVEFSLTYREKVLKTDIKFEEYIQT
ncbi:cyclic nucleotide-binding domain-containing protein, partial [Thermodesulfobacteriota bacterium]